MTVAKSTTAAKTIIAAKARTHDCRMCENNLRIIPTVLANAKEEFNARLHRLLPFTEELHVDFMDGRFVPSVGIAPDDIPDLKQWPSKTFEAHLMVEDPENWIELLSEKGFKRFIVHCEAVPDMDLLLLIDRVHKNGQKLLLAINPETDVRRLLSYTGLVDGVLFLGVHPGFNGAPYVTSTPARVAEFIALNKRPVPVQVDGGMTPDTIRGVVSAGAVVINSGSFVSNAYNPAAAIKELLSSANMVLIVKETKTLNQSHRETTNRRRTDTVKHNKTKCDDVKCDDVNHNKIRHNIVDRYRDMTALNAALYKRSKNNPRTNTKMKQNKKMNRSKTAIVKRNKTKREKLSIKDKPPHTINKKTPKPPSRRLSVKLPKNKKSHKITLGYLRNVQHKRPNRKSHK